jgi:hypothetical protein
VPPIPAAPSTKTEPPRNLIDSVSSIDLLSVECDFSHFTPVSAPAIQVFTGHCLFSVGATMRWMVFQLVTALVVLAFGIVLGRIWEARTTARSKKRIRRWN